MFEPRKVVRCWSEAVAVGGLSFVNTVKSELGFKAAHPDFGWFKPFKPFNRYAPFKPYA
jgi:hypothetical protein